jgi:glycosyltransferase involved in cell wall biosynthesis
MNEHASQHAGPALRVFIVSPEFPPYMTEGGLGTHVSELAQGLTRRGCLVTVLAPTLGPSASHRQGGITVQLISLAGLAGDPSLANFIREVSNYAAAYGRRLVAEQDALPDIIHCHDWTSIAAACELSEVFGRPLVATAHLLQDPLYTLWGAAMQPEIVAQERSLCRDADAVITVSRSMRDVIRQTYGVADDRIYVVYNGLNAGQFVTPRASREACGELRRELAAPAEKIVLFAGRLVPQKGIGALLASAAQVAAARPHVRYVIAGGNGYFDPNRSPEQAQAQTRQLLQTHLPADSPLWGRIKVLGMIPRAQVAMLYQVADLAVVPSVYEPFGYAAVEPMAAGLPVVATDVGGLSEIITHDETGWLVPLRANELGLHEVDVDRLTEAQIVLLDDEARARRLGAAGRQHVLANFNLDQMVRSTLQVYRRVIDKFDSDRDAERLEAMGV